MWSSSMTALALVAFCLLLASSSHAALKRGRVRKEIRRLSERELALYKQGLKIMEEINTEDGIRIFGPAYKEYSYFNIKHSIAVTDPRGDQGHFQPTFGVYHRALLLEFEAALLSVVPDLKALPYWDVTQDSPGGKYFNSKKKAFVSDQYAGLVDGDEEKNWQVTRGASAFRPIYKFDNEVYFAQAPIFNGTVGKHLLRTAQQYFNNNTLITRYPINTLLDLIKSTPGLPFRAVANFVVQDKFNRTVFNLTKDEWALCTDPSEYPDIIEWAKCVGFGHATSTWAQFKAALIHPGSHFVFGSFSPEVKLTRPPPAGFVDLIEGDYLDTATSPGESFLFWLHHANVDRNFYIWQERALAANATLGRADVLWGFPRTKDQCPVIAGQGGALPAWCATVDDIINSNFPSMNLGDAAPEKGTPYKFGETIELTRPNVNLPYTYDNLYPFSD